MVLSDPALGLLVRSYTRESGVRTLDRAVAACVRWVAAANVMEAEQSAIATAPTSKTLATVAPLPKVTVVDGTLIERILGPPKYEEEMRDRLSRPGVAVGLGYTGDGSGAVLYVETATMPGTGKLVLTGQLGDVMKESAQVRSVRTVWWAPHASYPQNALAWIRSNATLCQLDRAPLDGRDVHVHFPAGATPKDGPSAGIAIACALVSLLSGRCVRPDVAMTGELSLAGIVLPVGGVKEKVLAAHRHGIKTGERGRCPAALRHAHSLIVLLPQRCLKDLHDVPDVVKADMEFVAVASMEAVLQLALAPSPARDAPRVSKL